MQVHCLRPALSATVFFWLVSAALPALHAADPASSESVIRTASSGYLEALNSGEADRIATFWTPQGTYVDVGNQSHRARQLIKEEFTADAAPQERVDVQAHHSTVRLITSNVALEKGTTHVQEGDDRAGSETTFIALWVKSGDRWLLDYLQEFEVSSAATQGPLADLAWMVGQWKSQSDGIEANLSVSWSGQRQYLLQKFTVQLPGRQELRGEQRIAWDASKQQVRSWLFRSDGGFAEGVWTLEGDTWVVKKSEVAPTGEQINTVNLWVNETPDSCWFKSLNTGDESQQVKDLVLQFRRADSL